MIPLPAFYHEIVSPTSNLKPSVSQDKDIWNTWALQDQGAYPASLARSFIGPFNRYTAEALGYTGTQKDF